MPNVDGDLLVIAVLFRGKVDDGRPRPNRRSLLGSGPRSSNDRCGRHHSSTDDVSDSLGNGALLGRSHNPASPESLDNLGNRRSLVGFAAGDGALVGGQQKVVRCRYEFDEMLMGCWLSGLHLSLV